MLTYSIRRLAMAVPTLLLIALVIFALLELAPGDPMAQMPLTVSDAVRAEMRAALGLGEPAPVRFAAWMWQVFAVEPRVLLDDRRRALRLGDRVDRRLEHHRAARARRGDLDVRRAQLERLGVDVGLVQRRNPPRQRELRLVRRHRVPILRSGLPELLRHRALSRAPRARRVVLGRAAVLSLRILRRRNARA